MIIHFIRRLLLLLPVLALWATGLATPAIRPIDSVKYIGIGDDSIYRMKVQYTNQCMSQIQGFCTNWDLTIYDATVTLYQATQTITFETGYSTPAGATLMAQIVSPSGVPQATNLTGTPDNNINWIQTTNYDQTGTVIADSKNFYDNSGRDLQSQTKAFYRSTPTTLFTHVLASQSIRDAYGREAATTLPAPIDYADFSYRANFLQHNSLGAVYNHVNFDVSSSGDNTLQPQTLWDASTGTPVQGTLAWYYSTQNTWEPYTAVTNYPYSRQTWYQDGTGNVKKSAGLGEPLIMGTGHEQSSYTEPVADELDFYLQVRNQYFTTADLGALPTNLAGQSMQMVSHDGNGLETVEIKDREGLTLMTARPGTGLTVNNTVTIGAVGASDMNIYYFKLLSSGVVSITGGGYTLYDMNAEQAIAFNSGGSLTTGYYKVVNTGATPLTLIYSNSYTDVCYYFYNQKGLLVASIAPEGVKKLYTNGVAAYTSKSAIPFVSLNTYDLQGRLVSRLDPDQGTYANGQFTSGIHTYIYRKDGKLRFSQSPAQASMNPQAFSYTNYDALARPVEGGQYQPDANGISFSNTAALTAILENTSPGGGLTTGTKTDVSITQYDLPDYSYSTNTNNNLSLSRYVQDPANLGGAISVTWKYSSIVNNSPGSTNLVSATWYNYDEEGKVLWTIKYLNGLGTGVTDPAGYKTLDKTYDVFGDLTKSVFQANTSAETFVHYYDYDPVNKQLWHVYTNTTDNVSTRTLQATYYYYLHGGMKRVEIAGSLQGIDYTYTLQGLLKAINNSNSNSTQDPGADGNGNGFSADAFGEVLDYYTGDYTNGRPGMPVVTGVNSSTVPAFNTGGAGDSYTGNIKAMSWFTQKSGLPGSPSSAPTAYVYQYDNKYQFVGSTWGNNLTFNGGPASYTTTNLNQETVGNSGIAPYDQNGNIQYLQRTNANGIVTDQFSYQYGYGNNQLTTVTNTATNQPYATYTYDANGRLSVKNVPGSNPIYLAYDVTGKITGVYQDAFYSLPIVVFVYDETGTRVKKLSYNSSAQLVQVTYYVGDVVYIQQVTNGTTYGTVTPAEYQIKGSSRLGIYYPQGPIYAYELTDHLGSLRAIVAVNMGTMQVRGYSDYYPFGMVLAGGAPERYGYQGQHSEADPETGWNAFELRMYDSRIARWLTVDPVGENWSPYMGMSNDPVSKTDANGGCTTCPDSRSWSDPTQLWIDPNGTRWQATSTGWMQMEDQVVVHRTKAPSWGAGNIINPASWWSRTFGSETAEVSDLFDQTLASLNSKRKIILTGGLLEGLKTDPAMINRQSDLIDRAQSDPRYGQGKDFTFTSSRVIGFGGQIGGSKNWSALDASNPILNTATYDVAANPLTWSVRNAFITSVVSVHDNGNYIYIENYLYDTWDLSPQAGRPTLYNIISTVGGLPYHYGLGGNINLQTTAQWSTGIWVH